MEIPVETLVCKCCKAPATRGKYCSECSQSLAVKRISLSSILHEVFHFFTHVEKGFLYTISRLLTHPGTTQREYLEGQRVRHQKPFSMFLISATVVALVLYWINIILNRYYEAGDLREAQFFDKYMVLLLIFMAPLFSLITFIFFYRSQYNYAEILVFSLYTTAIFLLMVTLINLLRLIWPALETRIIEVPAIVLYNAITFKNFFTSGKRWWVIIKSIACAIASFAIIAAAQDFLVERFTV